MNPRHILTPPAPGRRPPWSGRRLPALSLLVLLAAAPVRADHKLVPGSICHGITWGSLAFDRQQSSILSTDSESSQKVVCPLIRDNGSRGILGPDLKVYVYNGSDEAGVTCRLWQALPQSGAAAQFSTSPQTAAGVGHTVLDFSPVSGAGGLALMTYFVECDLPARDTSPVSDPETGMPTDGISRIRHLSYEENVERAPEDHKLYPGALCMPVTADPAGWLRYEDTSGETGGPGLMGTVHAAASPGEFHVVCPIVRDAVAFDNGLVFAGVAFSDRQGTSLSDQPAAQRTLEVVCELFRHNALTGEATALADGQNTEPDHQSGTKFQGFNTFPMSRDLATEAGMEHYYALHCSLPQAETSLGECNGGSCWSGILSYGVWEVREESFASHGGKDWKTFPGAFCKRTPESHELEETASVRYTEAGELENPSGEDVAVTCPVLRDSTLGGSLHAAVVYVDDGHATEDVDCTFRARRGDRHDVIHPADSGSSSATGRQPVDFSVDGLGAGGTVGYYSIDCRLPGLHEGAASRIISYAIQEDLPTQ